MSCVCTPNLHEHSRCLGAGSQSHPCRLTTRCTVRATRPRAVDTEAVAKGKRALSAWNHSPIKLRTCMMWHSSCPTNFRGNEVSPHFPICRAFLNGSITRRMCPQREWRAGFRSWRSALPMNCFGPIRPQKQRPEIRGGSVAGSVRRKRRI